MERHEKVLSGIMLTASLAAAQKPAGPPAFEAASVKAAVAVGNFNPTHKRTTPVRVEYRNYPLRRLIAEAYDLADYQVQAPEWMAKERYEITATMPLHTTAEDSRQMMRSLLQERFHLATHRATKEMVVYYLLPDKIALLKPEHDEPEVPGCQSYGTLGEFAQMVARSLNSPVIDKTNIMGTYYFLLAYSGNVAGPELPAGSAPPPPKVAAPPPCPGWSSATITFLASDIFEASRKQMGLKIERHGKAQVEVLVVDRAEKLPVSN